MIRQVKIFFKEKLSAQKIIRLPRPRIDSKKFREAGKAAKDKANELKDLANVLPGYIRTLDGYGDFMNYTADELERFGTKYPSVPSIRTSLQFSPQNFMDTLSWNVTNPKEIEISITTLSGVGTSVTGSVLPVIESFAQPDDPFFSNPPQNFSQLRFTDDLTQLLDDLNPVLSPIWKSAWDNIVLEREDSLKNVSVNSRTVVDEVSWLTNYEHLKTLPWCELDKEGKPIRAVRYGWIRYGDNLPPELKNNSIKDLRWKVFGQAYSELGKFIHKAGFDKTSRSQIETALKALEIGLIDYLKDGMTRLIASRDAKKK